MIKRNNEAMIPDWMIIDAVRYAIGRMSYQVGETTDWLVENWNELPERVRAVIQQDLEEVFAKDDKERKDNRGPLGMDQDRRAWERGRGLWTK